MTKSKFLGLDVSLKSSDILLVGHAIGATRVNTGTGTTVDYTTGNGILKGGTDSCIKVDAANVMSVITAGEDNRVNYIGYDDTNITSISDDTLIKIAPLENYGGDLTNSWGAVHNQNGVVSLFSRNTSLFIRGIRIINDPDVVDFGDSGTLETFSVPESFIGEISPPTAMPIYNDSSTIANANVLISFTGKEEDEYIELSTTLSGNYYGIRENATKFPRDVPWENGYFENTQVTVDDTVTTSGETGPFVYVSPVIDTGIESVFHSSRVFWVSQEPGLSTIDFPDQINGQRSILFRQSDVPPSGSWVAGQLADLGDSLWDIDSGSLSFHASTNYSIDTLDKRYVQFKVNFEPDFKDGFLFGTELDGGFIFVNSGIQNDLPELEELGVEHPIKIYGIYPQQTLDVYIRSNIPSPPVGKRVLNTIRKVYLDTWWDFE